MLVIRRMVATDLPFLRKDKRYVTAYLNIFGHNIPERLEDMANEGYSGIGVDSLIALANAGISPSYIRGLADLGYSNISTNDLIRLANAGVTPKMIKSLRAHGFTEKLSVDQLIKLANNGF